MPYLKSLTEACTPRPSVFDPAVRDTVYNIDDLSRLDPAAFFAENYVTDGMRQLLTEAFGRLDGSSPNAPGAFLLSQSMGGGKTHNLIALGLLAKHPELRERVMGGFYTAAPLGAVRVVTFSGRKTNTPYGLWGEIAGQLGRDEVFKEFYSPLKPPGDEDWITLLEGDPVLIMLDELPPYFQGAQAVPVGSTSLDVITTTALANLLVAVTSGKLSNACVVLTDLRGSAYGVGSERITESLTNLEREANRTVMRIDPVRLNSDELYHIMRARLFETLPSAEEVAAVADAYGEAVDEAKRTDQTTASPQQMRANIVTSYPFHPGIRDLYARFRENPGFQQTRALIKLMRIVTAGLWQSEAAHHQHLIGVHDLDLHRADVLSEIRQINGTFDSAIAHDVASENASSVAEQIDGPGRSDAQDAAKLIFVASLSQAVNPALGLARSDVVAYLAAPNRDLGGLRAALDRLQAEAWYIHAAGTGVLLFKNVENLNAKLENYAQGMLSEQRENELRERLKLMFKPSTAACYQDLAPLPALDQVQPTQDRVTLVAFRSGPYALDEITRFYEHQQFKNRLLFLMGSEAGYQRVLHRSAYLRAIKAIIEEFRQQGLKEGDAQFMDALEIQTREEAQFYLACRESFQTLHYPHRNGLVRKEFDAQYAANSFDGETQIVTALADTHKYRVDVSPDGSFRTSLENKLWPEGQKQILWSDVKRRAATDPSWTWQHPRAMDELKETLIQRDIWRDIGGGFIERGPFPKPPASVTVQLLSRDLETGEVKLRVRPLHADKVFMAEEGVATEYATPIETYDVTTKDLSLSFLGVDSKGEHETGNAYLWQNTIEVKHRFFQDGDALRCELKAIPSGEIRYTIDGASPNTSGLPYDGPVLVPDGTRYVLAQASGDGIVSESARCDVPKGRLDQVTVDPQKPAVWKRRFGQDGTSETYTFLDQLDRHKAWPGGIKLTAQREQRWVELLTDDHTFQEPAVVRDQATMLTAILKAGHVTLDVQALQFSHGQDLLDLVRELKTTLKPGEVEQS
ncbi:MAG: DUF499 domain-containing protein [Thermomicrobiales bacterium]